LGDSVKVDFAEDFCPHRFSSAEHLTWRHWEVPLCLKVISLNLRITIPSFQGIVRDDIPYFLRIRENLSVTSHRIMEGLPILEKELGTITNISWDSPVKVLLASGQNLSNDHFVTICQSTNRLDARKRYTTLTEIEERLLNTSLPQSEVANKRTLSHYICVCIDIETVCGCQWELTNDLSILLTFQKELGLD